MESLFFRVDHDLIRSHSFQKLGGSATKVFLVLGLYADFETGWAYPSVRTIARLAGLSRQTVLVAIGELTAAGFLATTKKKGKSTAYRILKPAPERPSDRRRAKSGPASPTPRATEPEAAAGGQTGPDPGPPGDGAGPESRPVVAQAAGPAGPVGGPKQEPPKKEDNTTIPLPGTPFAVDLDGEVVVATSDLSSLLAAQRIPPRLAERFIQQHSPQAIARVLLNAHHLQGQGKLQNGPGYIRSGIEGEYDLLPQVSSRVDALRRELEAQIQANKVKQERIRQEASSHAEEAAMALVIASLTPPQVEALVQRAVDLLPEPLVRRNPTLTNPFVRGKVYELAGGDPQP